VRFSVKLIANERKKDCEKSHPLGFGLAGLERQGEAVYSEEGRLAVQIPGVPLA